MTRRSLQVLLVEDDLEDALLFRKRCPVGVRVHHVTTSPQALSALRESGFDACFVDYQLGPESGLDLVRAARRRDIGLPLIVVTGLQIEVLGENALLAGATDFIPKDDLDADTIERTVRWALIRRHVEVKRDEQSHADIVSQLMGRTPGPAHAGSSAPRLRRVLYVSIATRSLTASELLPWSSRFATSNARLGMTGLLLHTGERFLQFMEGPADAVAMLLRRIEEDARHGQMQIVIDEPARERLFDDWNVGLIRSATGSLRASASGEPAELAARIRARAGDPVSRPGMQELLTIFSKWV